MFELDEIVKFYFQVLQYSFLGLIRNRKQRDHSLPAQHSEIRKSALSSSGWMMSNKAIKNLLNMNCLSQIQYMTIKPWETGILIFVYLLLFNVIIFLEFWYFSNLHLLYAWISLLFLYIGHKLDTNVWSRLICSVTFAKHKFLIETKWQIVLFSSYTKLFN